MGQYINRINGEDIGVSFTEKCNSIEMAGGEKVDTEEFKEDLVCVVNNGLFAAAAHAYSENEFNVFKQPDGRPKQWYTLKNASTHVD